MSKLYKVGTPIWYEGELITIKKVTNNLQPYYLGNGEWVFHSQIRLAKIDEVERLLKNLKEKVVRVEQILTTLNNEK